MANEYVKLWCSYEAYFEPLSAAEVGRLTLAMMQYKLHGAEPVFSGNERFVWPAIRRDIDAQNESQELTAERNRANGALGGRPRNPEEPKKPSGFFENPEEPKKRQGQGQGHKEKDIPIGISKKKYGEFENVMLDGQEHGKLVDSLGDIGAAEYIERLSAYLAQTGHRYKSHYATLLNWWRKDGKPVKRTPEPCHMKPDAGREITPDMTAREIF